MRSVGNNIKGFSSLTMVVNTIFPPSTLNFYFAPHTSNKLIPALLLFIFFVVLIKIFCTDFVNQILNIIKWYIISPCLSPEFLIWYGVEHNIYHAFTFCSFLPAGHLTRERNIWRVVVLVKKGGRVKILSTVIIRLSQSSWAEAGSELGNKE